mmetsp:Transcript_47804/g.74599  ORF Transcript_47804/g.74599 Transcript_47804/m.74599 type:complete len:412 (+) Transcript_47804:570-1805(+)
MIPFDGGGGGGHNWNPYDVQRVQSPTHQSFGAPKWTSVDQAAPVGLVSFHPSDPTTHSGPMMVAQDPSAGFGVAAGAAGFQTVPFHTPGAPLASAMPMQQMHIGRQESTYQPTTRVYQPPYQPPYHHSVTHSSAAAGRSVSQGTTPGGYPEVITTTVAPFPVWISRPVHTAYTTAPQWMQASPSLMSHTSPNRTHSINPAGALGLDQASLSATITQPEVLPTPPEPTAGLKTKPMMGCKGYPLHVRNRVWQQLHQGERIETVAQANGVCARTVKRWVEKLREKGSIDPDPANGGTANASLTRVKLPDHLKGMLNVLRGMTDKKRMANIIDNIIISEKIESPPILRKLRRLQFKILKMTQPTRPYKKRNKEGGEGAEEEEEEGSAEEGQGASGTGGASTSSSSLAAATTVRK